MTLREQYETLIRRGMPKHPRVNYWPGGGTWPGDVPPRWWSTDHGLMCGGINESDAHDLITMHALRWVNGIREPMHKWLHYCIGDGDKTLTDILAATAHLEPK